MRKKTYLKIISTIIILVVLVKILTVLVAEPVIKNKIVSSLNEKNKMYIFEIGRIHISFIYRGLKIDDITISSSWKTASGNAMNGKIESIDIKGISIAKAIFRRSIDLRKVTIVNSGIIGIIPKVKGKSKLFVLPMNLHIGVLHIEKINVNIKYTETAQSYMVKEGTLNLYDLTASKKDTLTAGIVMNLDFTAEKAATVSADSLYTFAINDLNYSSDSKNMAASSFSMKPNYSDYNFTSRFKYQKDRIEAGFKNISVQGFNLSDYFKSGSIISSGIEISKMDLKVFRDKRKEFRHINKPSFQDMIYSFPGLLRIDSISLLNGDITYSEHAEKANVSGILTFNDINATISNITNDVKYKTESTSLSLKAKGMLMGKGKIAIFLKSRVYNVNNCFSVTGTLSGLELLELSTFIEKSSSIYVTSGTIDNMNFSFLADNKKASGTMTMLYHGLDIAVKNRQTGDTTALKEKIISSIANIKLKDSNPLPNKDVRIGIIDYERDPERFLFNYCAKAIMSGIKSSLVKNRNNLFSCFS